VNHLSVHIVSVRPTPKDAKGAWHKPSRRRDLPRAYLASACVKVADGAIAEIRGYPGLTDALAAF